MSASDTKRGSAEEKDDSVYWKLKEKIRIKDTR
jgi:hypothetical protein